MQTIIRLFKKKHVNEFHNRFRSLVLTNQYRPKYNLLKISKRNTLYTVFLPAGHAAPLSNSIAPQVKAHSHDGAGQEHGTHHKQADQQVQEGIKYGAVEN